MNRPKLKSSQFALLVVDGNTGHVLNTDFELFLSDEKDIYFVFDDLDSVRHFINHTNQKCNSYDYSIYDSEYKLIDFI